jgi:two-component system, OmpR family, phosphate regulon response regulator PhoB
MMQGISKRILLVDGDTGARTSLSEGLRAAGFATLEVGDAVSALEMLPAWLPDVVLLESRLPDTDGYTVLRDLKRDPTTQDVPVILLAVSAGESERVLGLQRGADDFFGKDCSVPELIARINALLRRSHQSPGVIMAGELRLEARSHRVTADEQVVPLRPAEFRLLHFFMTHPDTVHSRAQLLHRVWQFKAEMEERSVDVHVRRLRKALEPSRCDALIQTVRSVGYRFSTRA